MLTTCTFIFQQVRTIEPSFFKTTSGIHRRPFYGRHLVFPFLLCLCLMLILKSHEIQFVLILLINRIYLVNLMILLIVYQWQDHYFLFTETSRYTGTVCVALPPQANFFFYCLKISIIPLVSFHLNCYKIESLCYEVPMLCYECRIRPGCAIFFVLRRLFF